MRCARRREVVWLSIASLPYMLRMFSRIYGGQPAAIRPGEKGDRLLLNLVHLASSRSNSALLTDAFSSPLRAQRGAAKRER